MSISSPDRAPLGPPQFGLRTMLLVVASVAVLLGLSQWMSPISLAALVLLILSIIAHVAGNVIGTRLRKGQLASDKQQSNNDQHSSTTPLREDHFAPTTRLGSRHSLGWLPLASALSGFLIGALAGSLWTAWLLGRDFDWGTIALAAAAFGALGGIGGFLVVGFGKAFWDAWDQASRHSPVSKPEE